MKPRARRITIAAAALGVGVLAVFVVLNWSTVCDHLKAWGLQLAKESITIVPDPALKGKPGVGLFVGMSENTLRTLQAVGKDGVRLADLLHLLANYSGVPVVCAGPWAFGEATLCLVQVSPSLTDDSVLQALREGGYRVFQQRFPEKAWVIIPDAKLRAVLEGSSMPQR
jgi:hypothetical protein